MTDGPRDPIFDLSHIDPESPTADVELFAAKAALTAKLEAETAAFSRVADAFTAWHLASFEAECQGLVDTGYDTWVLRRNVTSMLETMATRFDPGPP